MIVALLAIAVGATVLSGLITIYYDVPRQMGAQFRNYGANMIFVARDSEAGFSMEDANAAAGMIDGEKLLGITPFRYETVRIHEQPVVAAGTSFESVKSTSPYWHIDGELPQKENQALLGKETAEGLGLKVGDSFNVTYSEKTDGKPNASELDLGVDMRVCGILETGGSEEDYIYVSMEDLQTVVKDKSGRIDIAELSISMSADELTALEQKISASETALSPRLIKRVTQSESTVLTKLQALVFLVTAVVLVLTMICVATTMTAVVTERRKEIGLRKALGASDSSIIREFMGEGLLLGGIGGIAGSVFGFLFAQFVSVNVFSSSITFQPLLVPVTVLVSVLVTGLACLIPVRSAIEVDPAVVLKGE